MPVWLSQNGLQRSGKERGSVVRALCQRQFILGQLRAKSLRCLVRGQCALFQGKRDRIPQQRRILQHEICALSALSFNMPSILLVTVLFFGLFSVSLDIPLVLTNFFQYPYLQIQKIRNEIQNIVIIIVIIINKLV